MSSYVFGRATASDRPATPGVTFSAEEQTNKLITAMAGLVPAEALAAHALALGWFTERQDDGSLSIVPAGETFLRVSLIVVLLGAFLLSVAGSKGVRRSSFVAPVAVLAWTAIIGTSALTPWVELLGLEPRWVALAGVGLGLVVVAWSRAVAEGSQPAT